MNIEQLYKNLPTDLKRIVFDFTYLYIHDDRKSIRYFVELQKRGEGLLDSIDHVIKLENKLECKIDTDKELIDLYNFFENIFHYRP